MSHRRRLVRLELGAAGRDVVEVVATLDRDRYRVRFPSGAELIVPTSITSNVATEEADHAQRQRRPHHPAEAPRLDI